jgi:hypothetical protein
VSGEKFNPTQAMIREVRSLLLDFINSVYPRAMGQELLKEVMLDLPEPVAPDLVDRDLVYLHQRGLIEPAIIPHPVNKTKAVHWKLAARGVTFIERGKPWAEIEALA